LNLDLSGRVALVCGASAGIGRAAAWELAEMGAAVVALARREAELAQLVAELPGEGHEVLVANLDDRLGLEEKVRALLTRRDAVHILVNNTGGPPPGPLLEAEEEAFLVGFGRHVLAGQLLARLCVPGMQEAGFGRIVNVVSTSVRAPIPNLGVSNTIRGALASWAKTLAGEVGLHGITVNNVLPGFTSTERLDKLKSQTSKRLGKTADEVERTWLGSVPMGRFGKPKELGAAVAFLASPAAGYITGESLRVDGGRTPSI